MMADCLLQYCQYYLLARSSPAVPPVIILIFLAVRHIHNKWKWWKIATKISPKSRKSSPIAPSTKRQLGIGPALTQQAQFCSAVTERFVKENTFV